MLCAKPVKNAEIQIFEIHIDAFAISYILSFLCFSRYLNFHTKNGLH